MNMLYTLIKEGEKLIVNITYNPASKDSVRISRKYRYYDEFRHEKWLAECRRFIRNNYPSELEEHQLLCKYVTPQNHTKQIALLHSLNTLPDENKPATKDALQTHINISNQLTNTNNISLSILLELIKEEVSGKEFNDLESILQDDKKSPEEKKSTLKEKLESFGGNILSDIISNILTNPSSYNL